MNNAFDTELRDVIQFHGHLCPGLALGYRVAKAAMRELKSERPQDEEVVAVVENDSCAVDAVQFITGATFGKGNLIFRDYGKHVYTFYSRRTGAGVRISEDYRGFDKDNRFQAIKERQQRGEDVSAEMTVYKMEKAGAILAAGEQEIMKITTISGPLPEKAIIRGSIRCSQCGEKLMETRSRMKDGAVVCIPCFEKG